MRKALIVAPVAPALSNEEINLRVIAMLQKDPNLAITLAARGLFAATKTRTTRNASSPENEMQRACRCAGFESGNRSKLLTACIVALGEKNEVTLAEADLMSATSLPSYRVRADMQTVQDRLNDTDNVAQFPAIRECGYKVHLKAETRGVARSYVFSRIAPVAPAKGKGKAKGKAIAPIAPPVANESESDSNAS